MKYHETLGAPGFCLDSGQAQFDTSDQAHVTHLPGPDVLDSPRPRPTSGSINDMGFWEDIFPKAMRRLIDTSGSPKTLNAEWGIMHLSSWRDVQAKLGMARRQYGHYHGSEHVGRVRRAVQSTLDKIAIPLQQGVRCIPDVGMASPVVGVIKILVDVSGLTSVRVLTYP